MKDIYYTHIVLVVDRSGSMSYIQADAQGGIDAFLTQQATLGMDDPKVRCTLTLVQFDDKYEVVYDFTNIKGGAPRYTLVPRGSTALLDAIGRAINSTEERIIAIPESQRPGQVYFVVMTDGAENASLEYTKAQVTKLIEDKRANDWQVTFLSSDLTAIGEAKSYGIAQGAILSTNVQNYGQAVYTNSNAITRSRIATYVGGQSVALEYTDEERESVA